MQQPTTAPQPLIEQLEDLRFEGLPDLVNPSALAEMLSPPPGSTVRGLPVAVAKWLASVGAVRHRPYSGSGDGRALWSLREHERYAEMGPAARLRSFLDASG